MENKKNMENENKKELIERAYKHALLGYNVSIQGKLFLIYPDGSFSGALNMEDIDEEDKNRSLGFCKFIDPDEVGDFDEYLKEYPEGDDFGFREYMCDFPPPDSFKIHIWDEEVD